MGVGMGGDALEMHSREGIAHGGASSGSSIILKHNSLPFLRNWDPKVTTLRCSTHVFSEDEFNVFSDANIGASPYLY